MEALIDQPLDPEALATRVKRLQDDWKALGGSDGDKALWDRFHAAAERAYEPCKAYYAKLAELRAHNLMQRQRMVDQLTQYLAQYDWPNADWKAVNEVFHLAKQEWRQYAPVERKAGDRVQAEFNAVLEQLKARLEGEFTRNRQAREALIRQAEALLQADDLGQAIQSVKQLQQSWKQVGLVERRDDQKLWKQFRSVCDQVFARRDEQRDSAQAERTAKVNEARRLLNLMSAALEDETQSADEVLEAWQSHLQAFQALDPLPREQRDELTQQQRQLETRVHALQHAARAARQQARLQQFWQRLAALDAPAAESAARDEPLSKDLPARLAQALQQRAQQPSAAAPDIDPAATERLRDLCVQMEILAGIPSPAPDQARRMALQLERLTAGLGQREARGSQLAEQVVELLVEWVQTRQADPQQRAALTPRLQEAVHQAGGF